MLAYLVPPLGVGVHGYLIWKLISLETFEITKTIKNVIQLQECMLDE